MNRHAILRSEMRTATALLAHYRASYDDAVKRLPPGHPYPEGIRLKLCRWIARERRVLALQVRVSMPFADRCER